MSNGLKLHQVYQWLTANGKPRASGYVTIWKKRCVAWHLMPPEPSTFEPGVLLLNLTTHKYLIGTGGDKEFGAERWSDFDEADATPPQPSAHG